jgi:hypothetical protein
MILLKRVDVGCGMNGICHVTSRNAQDPRSIHNKEQRTQETSRGVLWFESIFLIPSTPCGEKFYLSSLQG